MCSAPVNRRLLLNVSALPVLPMLLVLPLLPVLLVLSLRAVCSGCVAVQAEGCVDPGGKDMFGLSALHKFASWDKADLVVLLLPFLTPQQVWAHQECHCSIRR